MASHALEDLDVIFFEEQSEYWVYVTHINSPSNFFVRPLIYTEFLPLLEEHDELITTSQLEERHDMYTSIIFESMTLHKRVRGRILDVDDDTTSCFILSSDYGFIETDVTFDRIYMPKNDCNIPDLVTCCSLADCKPLEDNWSQKTIDAMKDFVGTEKALMYVRSNCVTTVMIDLVNSCPDDIATLLALGGFSQLTCKNKFIRNPIRIIEKNYKVPHYTYKEPCIDDILHVRVLSGDKLDSFYVAELNDFMKYFDNKKDFKYSCRFEKPLEVVDAQLGMSVVVTEYDKYERAVIKDLEDEMAKVQLVDWGTVKTVPISHLITLPIEYMNSPIAIFCSADETQAFGAGLPRHLLCPGFHFDVKIKKVGCKFDTPFLVDVIPVEGNRHKSSCHWAC